MVGVEKIQYYLTFEYSMLSLRITSYWVVSLAMDSKAITLSTHNEHGVFTRSVVVMVTYFFFSLLLGRLVADSFRELLGVFNGLLFFLPFTRVWGLDITLNLPDEIKPQTNLINFHCNNVDRFLKKGHTFSSKLDFNCNVN